SMLSTCPLMRTIMPRGRVGFIPSTTRSTALATDARSVPSTFACTSYVRAALKWVTFAGPVVRETAATLERSCGVEVGPTESGVVSSGFTDQLAYCGVCTATRYWTLYLVSSQ